MAYLLDTGVLLRLVNEDDALHETVLRAIEKLTSRQERLVITTQNVAEFYNVATRRVEDNGLGRSVHDALTAIRLGIAPLCKLLREHSRHYPNLLRLIAAHQVIGKQVHDARLVASMITWRVARILTLNEKHFLRFTTEGIVVETPQTVLSRP